MKRLFLALPLLLAAPASLRAQSPAASTIADDIRADMPQALKLYRDLHAHPELSGQEVKTAAKLARVARGLGFKVTEKVGGTGVVALMENGPGPVLMIRADMDALPVEEQTGLPYASKQRAKTREGLDTGVMHACGHDTHMAAWVQTARLMARRKDQWSGTLMMILQPAEETGQGAAAMLGDGLFTRFPRPTHALALHDASMPSGLIAYTPGGALANVDSVDILVRGVGGHGSMPASTRDPIVLGSRIVTTLQTLVSREQNPSDPAVVTVGAFNAGTKHNIIPDQATLLLTVRSFSDATRKRLLDGIARIARGEAIAAGLPDNLMPQVTVKDEFTPATYNPPEFAEEMAAVLSERFGADRVVRAPAAMAGEDFGRYYRADNRIRSFIFWVGAIPKPTWDAARAEGRALPSLHSPLWAPDAEAVIAMGSEAMTVAALNILRRD